VLVVAHTHWDREWYHPAGHFRHRLVALVDELLDAPPPHGESFLLDGQAIALGRLSGRSPLSAAPSCRHCSETADWKQGPGTSWLTS
jgi:hypothetical protein